MPGHEVDELTAAGSEHDRVRVSTQVPVELTEHPMPEYAHELQYPCTVRERKILINPTYLQSSDRHFE